MYSIDGMISPSRIAKAFKLSPNTVIKWSDPTYYENPLPFQSYHFVSKGNKEHNVLRIPIEQFWSWLRKHLHMINIKRYIPNALPMEPTWVEKERKKKRIDNPLLPPSNHLLVWENEDDEKLLELFYVKKKPCKEIAFLLNRAENSVKSRLDTLRETKKEKVSSFLPLRQNKPFHEIIDDKSLEYIKENYGKIDTEKLAKRFKVSVRTIERVAEHHGFLSMRVNQGYVTPYQIAQSFGICSKTVKRWSQLEGNSKPLPLFQLPNTGKSQKKYQMLGIEPEHLWKWVRENLDKVDLRKYSPLTMNPEPVWLYEALKEQRRTLPPFKQQTKWNEFVDKELWYLYYKCQMTQKEIAKKLGTTTVAVEKRLRRLRLKKVEKEKSKSKMA